MVSQNPASRRSPQQQSPSLSQPLSHGGQESVYEVEQLRRQLELKDKELLIKDAEIRRLEDSSYRPREYQQQRLRPRSDLRDHHHQLVPRIHNAGDNSRRSSRLIDVVYGGILVLLMGQINNIAMIGRHSTDYTQEPTIPRSLDGQSLVTDDAILSGVQQYRELKPWESTAPTPIELFMGDSAKKDDFVKHRHMCLQEVRHRQKKVFDDLLGHDMQKDDDLQILLVDPAYHKNVGDHMLTLGELYLIQETLQQRPPKQCHYVQAGGFYPICTDMIRGSDRDGTKLALWHAGGNWGDLWRGMFDWLIVRLCR